MPRWLKFELSSSGYSVRLSYGLTDMCAPGGSGGTCNDRRVGGLPIDLNVETYSISNTYAFIRNLKFQNHDANMTVNRNT